MLRSLFYATVPCIAFLTGVVYSIRYTARSVSSDAPFVAVMQFEVAEAPLRIAPNPVHRAISRAELKRVLATVRPYFNTRQLAGKVPTSATLHALRLWGIDSSFQTLPESGAESFVLVDGTQMVASLLDHKCHLATSAFRSQGMLVKSEAGFRVLTAMDGGYGSIETATHVGKVVQVMAEAGLPASCRTSTLDGYTGTLHDIVTSDASLVCRGTELEFLASGLSRFSKGNASWTNRFGEVWSFDRIARELLQSPVDAAACNGAHIPYALTILLRCNEHRGILGGDTARLVQARLRSLAESLERSQQSSGAWRWERPDTERERPSMYRDDFVASLAMTGHHLEWCALAPVEYRPPDGSLLRAATYLVSSWHEVQLKMQADWHVYLPATHAARALYLLAGAPDIDGGSWSIRHREVELSSEPSKSSANTYLTDE